MIINLGEFYSYYTCDSLIDVPDEIGAVLLQSKRAEKNYWNRLGTTRRISLYKAF